MFGRLIDVYATDNSTGERYILVNHEDGDNSLICRAEIDRYCGVETDKMVLTIYNLSSIIVGNIASNYYNYVITIVFGYQDTAMSTFFEGNLIRMMNQREDQVTTKTTFYVYDSGEFSSYGWFSGSFADGVNYYEIAEKVCKDGTYPISYSLDEKLKEYKVKGSLSYYNSQKEILQEIADKTGTTVNINDNMVIFADAANNNKEEVIVYTKKNESGKVVSNSGLIGIPTLDSDGLSFECIPNALMKVYCMVMIDNSIISINQSGVTPSISWGASLDADNLYRVINFSVILTNNGDESKMSVKALSRSIYDEYNR